ncbi:MAG: Serine-protein kinase RsbW [Chlamydiia bacterium]|nr:Serine-protein kinase RsbW [Chlamydiia bacterium]
MESRDFSATLSELDHIMSYLRSEMTKSGLVEKFAKQFEVALEEAVVNIINYAYAKPSGIIKLNTKFDSDSGSMEVIIRDKGKPFNPLLHECPNVPPKDLETQKIGGLGIHIIKKMVDSVRYEFVDGTNVLHLTKKINVS